MFTRKTTTRMKMSSTASTYATALYCLFAVSFLFTTSLGEWGLTSMEDSSVTYVSGTWLSESTSLLVGGTFDTGVISKSTDEGLTFSTVLTVPDEVYDIAYGNDSTVNYAVAVTEGGNVYISSDDGDSFSLGATLAAALYGVTFGSNGMVYTCGVARGSDVGGNLKAAVFRANASTTYTIWEDVSMNATVQLASIASANGVNVIAVGEMGTIYASSDMGMSWELQTSGTTEYLYGISVASATHYMAAGDKAIILTTTNGGNAWTSRQGAVISISGVSTSDSFIFHAIDMLSEEVAYAAVSNGYIIRTTDGGVTWESDDGFVSSEGVASLFSIAMYSTNIGVAGAISGTGAYVRFANPTSQPTGQPSAAPSSLTPTSQPTSTPTGFDVAGSEWIPYLTSSTSNAFVGATWASSTTAVLVGQQLIRGIIARSTDSGVTFEMAFVSYQLEDVASYTHSSNVVYVIAVSNAGYVFVSVDEGATFTQIYIDDIPFYGATIGQSGDAYICGGSNGVYTASVSDGFTTWTRVSPSTDWSVQFNAISSFDGIRAIAVGNQGQIYITTDSGVSWVNTSASGTNPLYDVSCASELICMIVGSDAVLLRTSDGGESFASLRDNVIGIGSISATTDFRSHVISMVSTAVAYLAASNGAIIKTVNSGSSWETDTTAALGTQLFALGMSTSAIGVAGNTMGTLYVKRVAPTAEPTIQPSEVPSGQPSGQPSGRPTARPTVAPAGVPTSMPTIMPTTATRIELLLTTSQILQNISAATFISDDEYSVGFEDAAATVLLGMPELFSIDVNVTSVADFPTIATNRRLNGISTPTAEVSAFVQGGLRGRMLDLSDSQTEVTFTVSFVLQETLFTNATEALRAINAYYAAAVAAGDLTAALRESNEQLFGNVTAVLWTNTFTILSQNVLRTPPTSSPTSFPTELSITRDGQNGSPTNADAVILGVVLGVTLPLLVVAGVLMYMGLGGTPSGKSQSGSPFARVKDNMARRCAFFLSLFGLTQSPTKRRSQAYRVRKDRAKDSFHRDEEKEEGGDDDSDSDESSSSSGSSSGDDGSSDGSSGSDGESDGSSGSSSGSSGSSGSDSESDETDSYAYESRAAHRLKRHTHTI